MLEYTPRLVEIVPEYVDHFRCNLVRCNPKLYEIILFMDYASHGDVTAAVEVINLIDHYYFPTSEIISVEVEIEGGV